MKLLHPDESRPNKFAVCNSGSNFYIEVVYSIKRNISSKLLVFSILFFRLN